MMWRTAPTLLCALLAATAARAGDFFVAPDGAPGGDGSMETPWDLQTALDHPAAVQPGDTIWLRGGTYGGGGATIFDTRLNGAETAPIILRAWPGERATIDGGFTAQSCSWVWWWGLEITNSSTERYCLTSERPYAINMLARGLKAINLVVHDVGHPGIGYWRTVGDGGEIHGTLFWANGLYDMGDPRFPNGWTRGSPIYAQNQDGLRYITDCISFRNFTTGMKAYTEGGWTDGFRIEGNINFDSPQWNLLQASKNNPTHDLKIVGNYLYRRAADGAQNLQTGYYSTDNVDAEIRDNYIVGGTSWACYVRRFETLTVTGNTFIGRGGLAQWDQGPATTCTWSSNVYHGGSATPFRLNSTSYDFAGWQTATGQDAGSTHTGALPTGVKTVVLANHYEPGRAHIAVYNWDLNPAVGVDVSAILDVGDRYEVRDAQNYYGAPVLSGVYQGGDLTLPMNLTTVTQPVGNVDYDHLGWRFTHTAPEFAAFVLLRQVEAFRLTLVAGWNLVSLPLRPHDPDPASVFPAAVVDAVWEYSGDGFAAPADIQPKKGYWVHATEAATLTLVGTRSADTAVLCEEGWNLVGVVGPDAAQPWQPAPDEPTITAAWEHGPPYAVPHGQFAEGRGLWVRASTSTLLWGEINGMDYYISPGGSDDDPGTQAQPWRTVGRGLTDLAPGDTLHLAPGIYNESNEISGLRGALHAPITIRGEPGAVIQAVGRDAFLLWEHSAHVVFEGLEITGGTRAGIVVALSKYVTIRNCHIHDNHKWQVQTCLCDYVTVEDCELSGAVTEHGVYFSTTDHPVARNNHIHDNERCGIHLNGDISEGGDGIVTDAEITGNIIHDCGAGGGAAVNIDGCERALVCNNLIFGNSAGGITSFKISAGRAGTGNRILHNTIYFAPGEGRYAVQLINGSREATVRNNILVCGKYGLEIDSASLPGLDSDYNIVLRHGSAQPVNHNGPMSLAGWRAVSGQDLNSIEVLPDFEDVGGNDYHLQADSPGVDDGVTVPEVSDDLDGLSRPQGPACDRGCYER